MDAPPTQPVAGREVPGGMESSEAPLGPQRVCEAPAGSVAGNEVPQPSVVEARSAVAASVAASPAKRTAGLGAAWRRGLELISRVPGPVWVVVVVASTFGPYLVGGIRSEQVVVYGAALALLWPIARSASRRPAGLGTIVVLWLVPTCVLTVGAFFPHTAPAPYTLGDSALAGIDDYVLPLALMGLVGYWMTRSDADGLLRSAAVVTITFASVNAVVAIMQFSGVLTGGTGLSAFWGRGPVVVALLALGSGRFTGIFDQPLEAGLVYALALFLLTYLWMGRRRRGVAWYLIPLALIVAGSFLTASKTVMVLGIPWLVLLLGFRSFRSRPARHWLFMVIPTVLVVGAVLVWGLGGRWYGSQQYHWWLESVGSIVSSPTPSGSSEPGEPAQGSVGGLVTGGGLAETITAGRFGEGGIVVDFIRVVVASEPWFGFGAAGLNMPSDSAWLELLTVSGLVGLWAYILLLGYLCVEWLRRSRGMPTGMWILSAGAIGLAVGGSIGFPPLTVNRGSTLLWVVLLISLFSAARLRWPWWRVPVDQVVGS